MYLVPVIAPVLDSLLARHATSQGRAKTRLARIIARLEQQKQQQQQQQQQNPQETTPDIHPTDPRPHAETHQALDTPRHGQTFKLQGPPTQDGQAEEEEPRPDSPLRQSALDPAGGLALERLRGGGGGGGEGAHR